MADQVDAVVLGLGPGGEDAAGRLAEAGLSVVGIEGRLVGGECPYWGCVPSKMVIRAANLVAEGRRVPEMAGRSEIWPDYAPVAQRIRDEATDNWDDRVAVERLEGKGARFVRGWGRLAGPGRVEVDGRVFEASRAVVLATGVSPAVPPVPGLADVPFWTNRDAIEARELPASMVVLGGGAIGVELAQAYARFGVAMTVVEAAPRLLALEEPESSEVAAEALRADGVTVLTGAGAQSVEHDGQSFTVVLADGTTHSAERLLVATGRRADLSALGVDSLGLDPTAAKVEVDDRLRAGERLWAIGDVTGRGAFTHVALYQSGIAVRDILGQAGSAADYSAVPRVTFTDPEIGAVGRTQEQARGDGVRVVTGLAAVASTTRGWIHQAGNEGFIKVVADADSGLLIGATSAGPVGGEVLGALAVAVHARVPVESLRRMIYAYPTFHRGIEAALADLEL